MSDEIEALIARYRSKGILVDTNILLLYLVGGVNRDRISRFNRTQQFIPEDYDLLLRLLSIFKTIFTTPNILTEVSNLTNQLKEPERSQCFWLIAQYITIWNEIYVDSRSAVAVEKFVKFGIADAGIVASAHNEFLILTDDFPLANYLQTLGVDVINFNNIRFLGWT